MTLLVGLCVGLCVASIAYGQDSCVEFEAVDDLTVSGTGAFANLTVTGPAYLATTSGNVGIGTTGPSQKLHVEGQCVTGDTLLPIIRNYSSNNMLSQNIEHDNGLGTHVPNSCGSPENASIWDFLSKKSRAYESMFKKSGPDGVIASPSEARASSFLTQKCQGLLQ